MVSLVRSLALAAVAALCAPWTSATFLACPTAPSTAGDRRTDKTQLKYATYNAEFLFLVGYGSLDCPGADCKWTTTADAQLHIKQVASVIKTLNADILHLNEVEDCNVLNAVITELAALGDATYKPYLVKGTDTSTGQNAALLTRVDPIVDLKRSSTAATLPVSNSTCPSATGYAATKSVSKHFYTTFRVPGFSKDLTVIGAHLLAGPTNKQRCFEREGQAQVLAGIASTALASGNHVIISGDLNDWSRTAIDRNNNQPISNALGILEGTKLFNAGALVAQTERYSDWYDVNSDCVYSLTEVSSLDHVVVSSSLKSAVSNVAFRHDVDTASCSGYNSDHYPVTVTIKAV